MRGIAIIGVLTLTAIAQAEPLHSPAVTGRGGMVVSEQELASRTGAEILDQGGNAADAAVATAFALAVVWPQAGNIGGGGFWISRDADGRLLTVDFRETAPTAATSDMYERAERGGAPRASLEGPLASGVPGSVAGLYLAHRRAGRLAWSKCLAPAIALARDGFLVTQDVHDSIARERSKLAAVPAAAAIFLPGAEPPAVGARLRQPDLARTLESIARKGPAGFYQGPVARQIADWQKRAGGLITREDLSSYRAIERSALEFSFAGFDVATLPPPSSGAIVAEIAGMVEALGPGRVASDGAESIHLLAEIEKRAFLDRNRYLADPGFVSIPLARLLSRPHFEELLSSIDPARATPTEQVAPPLEKPETTHFSVIDARGNAVAVTTTLNDSFGSGWIVPRAGFFMNNEMDDFATRPGRPNLYGLIQGKANAVEPGKRMLSSMCPLIAARLGRTRLIWGTPGGSTIITTNFQIMWRVLMRGESLAAALAAPRFHEQDYPDAIFLEKGRWPGETVAKLEAMGHEIRDRDDIGRVHAIEVLEDGTRVGVADPRAKGAAVAQAEPPANHPEAAHRAAGLM
jgi:gamma-glutamyltranspeptidase / glutathione hydrolase